MQAAVIKATLSRSLRCRGDKRQVPFELDPGFDSNSYQLGRVLAICDATYSASIKPRSNESPAMARLSLACGNPLIALTPLISLHIHHLSSIPTDKAVAGQKKIRVRSTYEENFRDAMSRIRKIPNGLSLDQQALLLLGFYHQNQFTFRSSSKSTSDKEQLS